MSFQGQRIGLRLAGSGDAAAIAALHTDSWRRHYRGAYADTSHDGPVEQDRLAVWTQRLGIGEGERFTLAVEKGDWLVGFCHVVLDTDPAWGALVDNLHVVHNRQRDRLGTRLMVEAARRVELRPRSALLLWVLEQNSRAQAFYRPLGGARRDSRLVNPPMGRPDHLVGDPIGHRIVWPDPRVLMDFPTQRS